jgi:ankyrin repeat protein
MSLNYSEIEKMLDNNEVDINQVDEDGNIALYYFIEQAIPQKHNNTYLKNFKNSICDIVNLLIEKGSDLNILNNKNENFFHIAIRHNLDDIVIEILKKNKKNKNKLNYDVENIYGDTPFRIVAQLKKFELGKVLFDMGVKIPKKKKEQSVSASI